MRINKCVAAYSTRQDKNNNTKKKVLGARRFVEKKIRPMFLVVCPSPFIFKTRAVLRLSFSTNLLSTAVLKRFKRRNVTTLVEEKLKFISACEKIRILNDMRK